MNLHVIAESRGNSIAWTLYDEEEFISSGEVYTNPSHIFRHNAEAQILYDVLLQTGHKVEPSDLLYAASN